MDSGDLQLHCLLVPYPLQGHINPILQFAKRLSTKFSQISLALTKSINHFPAATATSISIRTFSDGFDDGGRHAATSFDEYRDRFEQVGRETLSDLVREFSDSGRPVSCIVFDPFIPWILDVANGFGLPAAAFFTQSCAVNSVYYDAYCGRVKPPLGKGEAVVVAPELPALKPEELPSFVYVAGSYPQAFEMLKNQFRDIARADWIFMNTFYELEDKVIDWFSRFWRIRAIGPTIPSMYLDKRLQDDTEYGLSIFNPSSDTCINWLNQQQSQSVIYIAFGSLAQLSIEHTQELARALITSDKPFLWVVRKSEESKLPNSFPSKKGLIVSWCPQLQVLAHNAVGCFITHCGWNSTLEGLSLGVPMVAMPQWTDQSTNSKFIADIWKVGVWAKPDDGNGIVKENSIVCAIEQVMEGDSAVEIKRNVIMWKKLAQEAMDEGGSSDTNIEEFVSDVKKRCKLGL